MTISLADAHYNVAAASINERWALLDLRNAEANPSCDEVAVLALRQQYETARQQRIEAERVHEAARQREANGEWPDRPVAMY